MPRNVDRIASKAGLGEQFLERLVELGVLPEDNIGEEHIPLARLAAGLEESGVDLSQLAELVQSGDLSLEYINRAFVRETGLTTGSFFILADELDVSEQFAQDIAVALGVAESEQSGLIREDDARTFRLLSEMVALGIDESVVTQMFQVMADSLRRMTRASSEMWTEGVQKPLLESGMTYQDIVEAQTLNGPRLQAIGAQVVETVWSRYLDDEIFSGTVEILEHALEEAGVMRSRDIHDPAIAFLDLSTFTARTDDLGDDAVAADARNLTRLIRESLIPHRGTLVKMLGDGAMLHFDNPVDAVACALHLNTLIPSSGLPPARFGIESGPIIIKDVDFFGHTVNVAARLVDYARPSEVLVTANLVASATDGGISFREIGPVSLKGVATPVDVWAAIAEI